MGLHDGHRNRMKAEFLEGGLDHMPPHRVMELLLFYPIPQGDTNELAHRLVEHFGSLSGVLDAPYEELLKVKGVGKHTAVLIQLISSMARQYYMEKADLAPLQDPMHTIGEQMKARYVGRTEERLMLVCLDNKLKTLFFDTVKTGAADSVQVQFRELAKITLGCNATNVILGHNHPNGLALPSRADRESTKELHRMFREIGVNLLDHIVVAGDDYVSMAETGLFSEF